MTYRELLKLYKLGQIDPVEKSIVDADLEKHSALNEYLFENDVIPGLEDTTDETVDNTDAEAKGALTAALDISEKAPARPTEKASTQRPIAFASRASIADAQADRENAEFTKAVRRTIRRAFVKAGVITGAAVLAIVLFVTLALPSLVSAFYYNPTADVPGSGNTDEYMQSNRMSLDMAVYSELMLPGNHCIHAEARNNGYGSYEFTISQSVSYNDRFTSVSGNIRRNDMTLYDTNILRTMPGNEFGWFQRDSSTTPLTEQDKKERAQLSENEEPVHGVIDREATKDELAGLESGKKYQAYVTLNEMMDYDDFYKYAVTNEDFGDVWCAVKTDKSNGGDNIGPLGFYCAPATGGGIAWPKEEYPELLTDIDDEKLTESDFVRKHFSQLMNYMSDQEEFCQMLDIDREALDNAQKYVKKNGIKIYGFSTLADKATLLELFEDAQVYSIDAAEIR